MNRLAVIAVSIAVGGSLAAAGLILFGHPDPLPACAIPAALR